MLTVIDEAMPISPDPLHLHPESAVIKWTLEQKYVLLLAVITHWLAVKLLIHIVPFTQWQVMPNLQACSI